MKNSDISHCRAPGGSPTYSYVRYKHKISLFDFLLERGLKFVISDLNLFKIDVQCI